MVTCRLDAASALLDSRLEGERVGTQAGGCCWLLFWSSIYHTLNATSSDHGTLIPGKALAP